MNRSWKGKILTMKIKKHRDLLIAIIVFLLLTQTPAFLANIWSGEDYRFGGYLFNPLDGNSYLAKMRRGWNGHWDFQLPFSAESGKGAFLFVFYIFLGHVSRWLNLDLNLVFHTSRLIFSFFMVWRIYRFFVNSFPEGFPTLTFYWVLFGGGLGGLFLPFNILSPDYWVAEGYPFLSAFANPHFPLSIALMLWMLETNHTPLKSNASDLFLLFLSGVILSNISPFAVVLVLLLYGIKFLQAVMEKNKEAQNYFLIKSAILGAGSLPFLIYQSWIVRVDVLLKSWNAQNVTPAPSVLLFCIGYSPLLVWALLSLFFERPKSWVRKFWFEWLVIALLLIYFPSSLQRRFMLGLYIPIGIGAAQGFQFLQAKFPSQRGFGFLYKLSFGVSLLTNVILLFASLTAVLRYDRWIYLTRLEADAYQWMRENLPEESLVLAGEQSGLLIPGWSGQRVIYGHPYESVDADNSREGVNAFYSGEMDLNRQISFLCNYHVDYILWGYREKEFEYSTPEILTLDDFIQPIFSNHDVSIFEVRNEGLCGRGIN